MGWELEHVSHLVWEEEVETVQSLVRSGWLLEADKMMEVWQRWIHEKLSLVVQLRTETMTSPRSGWTKLERCRSSSVAS